MVGKTDDTEVWKSFLKGEATAFEEIYRRYYLKNSLSLTYVKARSFYYL